MGPRKWTVSGIFSGLLIFGLAGTAWAIFLDGNRTLELTGKAQSRVSLRLNDSEGFSSPEVSSGDMVQWRNLLYMEVNHDLLDLQEELGILKPLKWAGLRTKYRLVGRFLYEGVYDVGPQQFKDVKDQDRENIKSFSQQYDLWEAYVDIARGPAFFRLGKQNLSWGETDVFRLLDLINPLDNTYGGIFEDLDDRRIPLWMLRTSYNIGYIGPVASMTLEGFWVPGFWDATVAPLSPAGTPYAAPLAPAPLPLKVSTPGKTESNSRWGVRVQGILGESLNLSVAHYKSFLDMPSSVLMVEDTGGLIPNMYVDLLWDDVQVTGAALNWWESRTDVVVRSEVALFWDEAVFIPEVNAPLVPTPIPGLALPAQGSIPEKDILRFMLGLDKSLWIRKLNPTNTFFVSLQYFGQYILDYDDRIKQPVNLYPDATDYAGLREVESTITFLTNTMYLRGRLNPQFVLAYDVRGAWMIQPQINFIYEPLRFMIQYSTITGAFTNFGVFQDRDQISFIFSYLLN